MIAALYVETDGAYFGLEDVDPWDAERDARLYAGPHPIVAHPPCQKWCQLAPLNASRLPDYHVGDDGGCFEAALAAVRAHGGVLEHPAYSLAWPRYGLPRPIRGQWRTTLDDPGWVTEVSQSSYGHAARKRTWLYAVGCQLPTFELSEPPATAQVSAFGLKKVGRAYSESLDHGKSSYTPPAFRDALLDMARSVAC